MELASFRSISVMIKATSSSRSLLTSRPVISQSTHTSLSVIFLFDKFLV